VLYHYFPSSLTLLLVYALKLLQQLYSVQSSWVITEVNVPVSMKKYSTMAKVQLTSTRPLPEEADQTGNEKAVWNGY
jgi:hypothetical protein